MRSQAEDETEIAKAVASLQKMTHEGGRNRNVDIKTTEVQLLGYAARFDEAMLIWREIQVETRGRIPERTLNVVRPSSPLFGLLFPPLFGWIGNKTSFLVLGGETHLTYVSISPSSFSTLSPSLFRRFSVRIKDARYR